MTNPPSCLSEIEFAALLQYSPDGTSPVAVTSRGEVRCIKQGYSSRIERIGLRVATWFAEGGISAMFGGDVVLVPVPRSQPFRDKTALWPAMRIAQELVRRRLARDVRPSLVRREPVEKSALQRSGARRPTVEDHVRTMVVDCGLMADGDRIVLVDDVVTRGATFLGCATLLRHALPASEIRAFAAVRTMSRMEIDCMLAPVSGGIRLVDGRPHREP